MFCAKFQSLKIPNVIFESFFQNLVELLELNRGPPPVAMASEEGFKWGDNNSQLRRNKARKNESSIIGNRKSFRKM